MTQHQRTQHQMIQEQITQHSASNQFFLWKSREFLGFLIFYLHLLRKSCRSVAISRHFLRKSPANALLTDRWSMKCIFYLIQNASRKREKQALRCLGGSSGAGWCLLVAFLLFSVCAVWCLCSLVFLVFGLCWCLLVSGGPGGGWCCCQRV